MKGKNKKAGSRGSKGENEQPDPGRINEYNFFLAQDEKAVGEGVPEENEKTKTGNGANKSMTFFLSE
jgi:hypothetical protein